MISEYLKLNELFQDYSFIKQIKYLFLYKHSSKLVPNNHNINWNYDNKNGGELYNEPFLKNKKMSKFIQVLHMITKVIKILI